MPRSSVDPSLVRKEINGVAFPLGAYPVEDMTPRTGYTLTFEPADGDDEDGDWEEWPDRYVFDIFLSATRVESLCRSLFAMLPGRFYPILDVLGHDEYREVDPYVAYELISQERFYDAIRRYRGFFYEDGLVGFGAMSEEPFVYIFVDEHKIVTVRVQADMRERVERLLNAFDLAEVDEIAGADAATHEHRGVLHAPDDRLDLLTADEIVEEVRNDWGLVLNIDPDTNVDDEGNELNITAWRCLARHEISPDLPVAPAEKGAEGDAAAAEKPTSTEPPLVKARYAEILLTAESIAAAERLMWEGMEQLTGKARSPRPPQPKRDEAGAPESLEDESADESDTDLDSEIPDDRYDLLPGAGPAAIGGRSGSGDDDSVNIAVALDRILPESFAEILQQLPPDDPMHGKKPDFSESKVWHARWLES